MTYLECHYYNIFLKSSMCSIILFCDSTLLNFGIYCTFLKVNVSLPFVFSFMFPLLHYFLHCTSQRKQCLKAYILTLLKLLNLKPIILNSLDWPSTKKKKVLIWRKKMSAFLLKILHLSLTYRNILSPLKFYLLMFLPRVSIIRADKHLMLEKIWMDIPK